MGRRFILALIVAFSAVATHAQNYRYEAETGTMFGTLVRNNVPGYSGTGFVTDFTNSSDRFELQANIPAGLYEMWIGYRSQFGEKGYTYRVNDETGSGMFDQSNTWSTDRAGLFNITVGT